MHVVVVGSGLAGLLTALRLARGAIGDSDAEGAAPIGPAADSAVPRPRLAAPRRVSSTIQEITLVTSGSLGGGSSIWAQGGIAAATGVDDSPELHTADTIAAGAGLVDEDAAVAVCAAAPAVIAELLALGVAFDRDATGELARGLEAAHSRARVLHAGGDATGARVVESLERLVVASRVAVREHVTVSSILTDLGRAAGVVIETSTGRRSIAADAVVLATGGYGALYPRTTNPSSSIGSGVVLAHRAGAAVADLEFMQFHPTVLASGGLISEAVRGEGAVLRDERGRRFMTTVDARAELAPRDVVARAIARTMREQGGTSVALDATALGGSEQLAARFPTIDRLVRASGIDWGRQPVPVAPAAHYAMGGVLADLDGRTTVPGLFAVGETAATGVHGANRLASNSLLEAAVMARRLSDALLDDPVSTIQEPARSSPRVADAPRRADAFLDGETPITADEIRARAWSALGLEREGRDLDTLARELAESRPADPVAETLLPLARLVTAAAIERFESRGSHWRADAPESVASQAVRRAWRPSAQTSPELSTARTVGALTPEDSSAPATTAAAGGGVRAATGADRPHTQTPSRRGAA